MNIKEYEEDDNFEDNEDQDYENSWDNYNFDSNKSSCTQNYFLIPQKTRVFVNRVFERKLQVSASFSNITNITEIIKKELEEISSLAIKLSSEEHLSFFLGDTAAMIAGNSLVDSEETK